MFAFQKITLVRQIILISAIPMVAILFFGYSLISKEFSTFSSTSNLQTALNIAFRATDLIHELQKERGLTAGYLASKGAKFSSELQQQQQQSDARLQELVSAYAEAARSDFTAQFINPIAQGMEQVASLQKARGDIRSLSITASEGIGFYSSLIAKYLKGISAVGGEGSDALLSSLSGAFGYFLNAKELAGQERAVVNGIISRNTPISQEWFMRWNSLYFGQDTLMRSFMALAGKSTVEFYNRTVTGAPIAQVDRFRETVRQKAETGDFGINPAEWFGASTERINLMRQVSEQQMSLIHDQTQGLIESAREHLIFYAVLTGIIVLVVIFVVSMIARSLNHFFTHSISDISEANSQVVAASDQIATSATNLAEGASAQAAGIEKINEVVQDALHSNQENAQNAEEADRLANTTNSSAKEGEVSISNLMDSMVNITRASEKIASIIKNIDEIAFQTNLLALNAAVEAARAGEHGLGFAVVADEVKSLASRSAQSAKETATIIQETIDHIKEGNVIARNTQEVFSSILANASQTTGLISAISLSLREQVGKMESISKEMGQIDTVTQQNAATSEEAAAASEELNAQALSMMHNVIDVARLVGIQMDEEGNMTNKKLLPKKVGN